MRRLVILRPEPGASRSVERARAMGVDATAMPLFRIEPVEWRAPEPGRFNGLLLTSANALRHGGEQLASVRALPAYAVGTATAEAARAAGFDLAASGEAGVERLLGSLEPRLRLLHLCGEHRREPGAAAQQITAVPVYRAVPLPPPDGLREIDGCVVAVHSPRAAARLAELADDAGLDRASIGIAAISAEAARAAGRGWQCVEAAERPDDGALLALAARLCNNAGER